jgi:hypothetical protein
LPVGRDFRQQVNQVPPLGVVERRQEGVGCADERGGRLALRAPAAGGQVDEERATPSSPAPRTASGSTSPGPWPAGT